MKKSEDAGDSKNRSVVRHRPHQLDHLDRLWMDGQFFGSTN
jgi:hypothetical protein